MSEREAPGERVPLEAPGEAAPMDAAPGQDAAVERGQGARRARRGPAPIASFDHDGSDESSPETKQTLRLPEIREDAAPGGAPRARSLSTPACGALGAPAAPRIDISRASSSSHQDSRDSSPELALFAGAPGDAARHELGFREDGALDLRSSTEELAFLEPAPGEPGAAPRAAPAAPAPRPAAPAPPAPAERRHSRKDSQGSEAALLAVSGRTSRLSSVGSQCSALSAASRLSRLSVVSGASRSPSPHRMLLETSFCGPKPIETDPDSCADALVGRILGLVSATGEPLPALLAGDARDHREVRTEATVESARAVPAVPVAAPPPPAPAAPAPPPDPAPPPTSDAPEADGRGEPRVQAEERRARPRMRREPSEPEVYKSRNKSKDIIRIKLKPDDSCEEEEEESELPAGRSKPATLELGPPARPAAAPPSAAPPSPAPSRRRSPSPAAAPVSRKSSFCSLFKSRETIASPESPSEALRRKRSLTEGRSRSKSRDRSATPTSATKVRGSVLSLFRTPRRSGASPSPSSREGSPGVAAPRAPDAVAAPPDRRRADRLKYYEDTTNGIIHIPLRTPPDEAGPARRGSGPGPAPPPPRESRPASAPQPRPAPPAPRAPTEPLHRTVLPDGSIIIPLRSPTERSSESTFPEPELRVDDDVPKAPDEPIVVPGRVESAVTAAAEVTPATSPPREGGGRPGGAGGAEAAEDARRRRKERLTFTTHVGSREQVFSTQFSITKTPSVTSEISGSFPSFGSCAEPPQATTQEAQEAQVAQEAREAEGAQRAPETQDGARDSSESEGSSEAAPPTPASDVERRGLVVQESFEEELPYVPTTLPQERSVALPMVPVRERGGVRVCGVQRPRAAAPPAPPPPPPRAAPPPPADRLTIRLPRRPRPAAAPAAARDPHRTRSGGDSGSESRTKKEWIDFEEVPERRKQPKRIQTLPAGAGGVLVSYVEPEHCRCECHAHDRLPPLDARASTSSAEGGEEDGAAPQPVPAPGPARAAPH